jgi:ribosome-associated protein
MTIPAESSGSSVPAGFRVVEISREPIELYKVLKFEGMASSGGHARAAVGSGHVLVNGVIETRKRKKISSGDTIEFDNDKICVKFCPPTSADVQVKAKVKVGSEVMRHEKADESGDGKLVTRPKKV